MARTNRGRKAAERIAVIDSETDPFEYGATIESFVWGFYDGTTYKDFWDTPLLSGLEQLCDYLESITTPLIIYAHNSGKFDAMFFLRKGKIAPGSMLIINGRIVKCKIGIHELRDSYAIMPIALDQYNKDDIDYQKMRRDRRDRHRAEILRYLKSDCINLFELCDAFVRKFGLKLTVGATAISQLSKEHPVIRLDGAHDEQFRPYYFGGRVQCFSYGEHRGNFKIFDVNSMYPDAMKNALHPIGAKYVDLYGAEADREFSRGTGRLHRFPNAPYFMRFIGAHAGCLPTRTKDNGLSFEPSAGEFFVCSHEIIAAVELGLLLVDRVLEIHIPAAYLSFDAFVDKWSAEKVGAKNRKTACEKAGDIQGQREAERDELFAKFMLNSAYGKYATNPENFKEWFLIDCTTREGLEALAVWKATKFDEWESWAIKNKPELLPYLYKAPHLEHDMGRFEIWTAPALVGERSYFDVACAASITSASRAKLMRAIALANRPLYCDTDSIICEDLTGVPIHDSTLGAWKLEKTATHIYIAGRKLYCALSPDAPKKPPSKKQAEKMRPTWIDGEKLWPVKMASKGADLGPAEIIQLCHGISAEWRNFAPSFKVDGSSTYVKRTIKARYDVDAHMRGAHN